MSNQALIQFIKERNEKLIYFIIGEIGSGKTILSKQLKEKLGEDTKIFEDYEYHTQKLKKPYFEVLNEIAKVRHTRNKIIINMVHTYSLHKQFSFKRNSHIVWVLTSLSIERYSFLKEMGVNEKTLTKFYNGYKNAIKGKRKTRPYLTITLAENSLDKIEYGHHRYKLQEIHSQRNEKLG